VVFSDELIAEYLSAFAPGTNFYDSVAWFHNDLNATDAEKLPVGFEPWVKPFLIRALPVMRAFARFVECRAKDDPVPSIHPHLAQQADLSL